MNILGPEFSRQIWMRFSRFSLIVMPLLIGLGILAVYMSAAPALTDTVFPANARYHPLYVVRMAWQSWLSTPALITYFIAVILIGSYEASSAFTEEMKNNTWDLQRMSSIRASHLLFGKLFGVTSYVWYLGVPLLAIIYFSQHFQFRDITPHVAPKFMGPVKPVLAYPSESDIASHICLLILAALAGHVLALLGSLHNVLRGTHGNILSFIAGLLVAGLILKLSGILFISTLGARTADSMSIPWYGIQVPMRLFAIASISYFIFCGILALHRDVLIALRFQIVPALWAMFTIGFIVYGCGISVDFHLADFIFPVPFFLVLVTTYFQLASAAGNLSGYLKLVSGIRKRDAWKCAENAPIWMANFFLLMITLVWGIWGYHHADLPDRYIKRYVIGLLSCVLFLIRDGLVLHALLLRPAGKNTRLTVVVYYCLFYGLFPVMFAWGQPMLFGSVDLKDVLWPFFYPNLKASFAIGLFPATIEIFIAAVYLIFRLRSLLAIEQPEKKTT